MSKLDTITRNTNCNFVANTAFRTYSSPRKRVSTVNTDPSLTKQNHKQETDINVILARHMKTGVIEHQNDHPGHYGDFTSVDYQESMNIVAKAQSMFEDLPSQIRNKFENDPSQFLDFVQDPQNEDELVQMGLANKREKIEPSAPITAPNVGSNEDGAKAPSDKPQGASGTVTT